MGVVVGILLTVLESDPKRRRWMPSPTGIGIGMLVPGSAVFTMFVGGLVGEIWRKLSRDAYEHHVTPLASGFIAGEAIVAVLIPILVAIGWVRLH